MWMTTTYLHSLLPAYYKMPAPSLDQHPSQASDPNCVLKFSISNAHATSQTHNPPPSIPSPSTPNTLSYCPPDQHRPSTSITSIPQHTQHQTRSSRLYTSNTLRSLRQLSSIPKATRSFSAEEDDTSTPGTSRQAPFKK